MSASIRGFGDTGGCVSWDDCLRWWTLSVFSGQTVECPTGSHSWDGGARHCQEGAGGFCLHFINYIHRCWAIWQRSVIYIWHV